MSLTTLDLLHEPEPRVPRWKPARARIRKWWSARHGRFAIVLAESASAHMAIIILLIVTHSSSLAGRRAPVESNLETIRQTLAELSRNPDNAGFKGGTPEEEEALAKTLDEALKLSADIDRKQKGEIIKAMIRSFYRMRDVQGGTYTDLSNMTLDEVQALLEQSGILRLPSGEKAFSAKGADPNKGFQLYKLDKSREFQVERLQRGRQDEKEAADKFGDQVRIGSRYPTKSGVKSIPQEVYFRKCPYEGLLARGASLFTAARGFPRFASELRGAGGETDGRAKPKAAATKADPEFLTVYLIHNAPPDGGGRPGGTMTPPEIDIRTINELLDEWMALPEAKQWAAFDRDFLRRFPANSEDLARMAKRFIAANLNGVFYMTDDFAMAFDFIEELYYKRPLYDALSVYALRHPGTRTAAEFLFSLADAYDFERRTLVFLDAVAADAADMLANRARRTSAFDYKAKAFVLQEMADDVRADLKRRGFGSLDEVARRYRKESLAIYGLLAEMGGEIRDRALYASGLTIWEDGRPADAFAVWKKVSEAFSLPVFKRIRPYLDRSRDALFEAVSRVGGILAEGAQAGSAPLLSRQLKYHKWAVRADSLPKGDRP